MNDIRVYLPDRYSINVNVFTFVRCYSVHSFVGYSQQRCFMLQKLSEKSIKSRYYLILMESNIDKTHAQFEARLAIDFRKICTREARGGGELII